MSNTFAVCQGVDAAAQLFRALSGNERPNPPKKNWKKQPKGRNQYYHKRQQSTDNKPHQKGHKFPREKHTIDAPSLDGCSIVGDSIGVRMARAHKVYAPNNMKICFGGATIKTLQERLTNVRSIPSKSVIVIVGMNNILKNEEVTENNINSLLNNLKQKGVEKIYCTAVPPIYEGDQKEGINSKILTLNELMEKAANHPESNVYFVDTKSLFFVNGDVNLSLFQKFHTSDKNDRLIHPNEKGLREYKKLIFDFIDATELQSMVV